MKPKIDEIKKLMRKFAEKHIDDFNPRMWIFKIFEEPDSFRVNYVWRGKGETLLYYSYPNKYIIICVNGKEKRVIKVK